MTRHRSWSKFRHFNVKRFLHGLTHWEKRCSFIGYSDCRVNGHVGNILLSFAVLLSLFRLTTRRTKKVCPYRKNKVILQVKVYVAYSETNETEKPFLKCKIFSTIMALLAIGLVSFGTGMDYGIPNNRTLYDYNTTNGTIESDFHVETLNYYSLWVIMNSGFILMLLLLCGDVEQNPGPQIGDKALVSKLLNMIKWKNEMGNMENLQIYDSLCSVWENIADILGMIKVRKSLKLIPVNNNSHIMEVFTKWIEDKVNIDERSDYSCTWNGLCKLLDDINHSTIRSELQKALKSPESSLTTFYDEDGGNEDNPEYAHVYEDPDPARRFDLTFFYATVKGSMPDSEFEALKERLVGDSNEMMCKFSNILNKFRKFLKKSDKQVLEDVKSILRTLVDHPTVRKNPHRTIKNDLDEAKGVNEIIEIISNYSSFFSYYLLETIFDQLEYKEGKQEIKKHKKEVKAYAECRLLSHTPKGMGITGREKAIVKFILDGSYSECSAGILGSFHKELCQLLNIPRYILVLDGPSAGSICIEFHIPAHLKFQVFPLSEKQFECLKMIRFGNAKIEAVICENFQYDIRGGISEKPTPLACIIIAGQTKSGKKTALNNIFGFDLSKRSSPSIVGEYFEIEDITKKARTLRIINTPGFNKNSPDIKGMIKEMKDAINKLEYTVLYCLPLSPYSYISPADEATIQNLSDVLGNEIWKRCILLLTFSDTVKADDEQKKEIFQDITRAFLEHTRRLGSNLDGVKSIFDYGSVTEQEKEEFPGMLLASPVAQRREKVIDMLKGYISEDLNWTDTVFFEMMKRTPNQSRHVFVSMKYDFLTYNLLRPVRPAVYTGVGSVGSIIGGLTGLFFSPPGITAGAAAGAAVGLVAGAAAGKAVMSGLTAGAAAGAAAGGGIGLALSISSIVEKVREGKKRSRAAENIDSM